MSWRTLTSDPQILSIVSGYKISFLKTPFQKSPPFTQASGQEALLISQEVNELLQKGAIQKTPYTRDGFYSRLFLVPKKGGSMRPVIDLSSLNKFIVNEHFQMENLSCLKTLLLPGDFMTNIDLKDAYLSVPVHVSSRKFLRFIWKGTCYQFKALPFGLCSAPRIFTKVLKPVAAFLRRKAIRVLIYLDDFLLLAATVEEAVENTQLVVTLLQSLGFTINLKKSLLVPTQVITFLGFQVDSMCMMISLPADKANKILDCCRRLLVSQSITLRNLASFLGLLESSRPAIWRAPLHFRHLQSDLIRGLQMNQESYDAVIALSPSARVELAWWLKHTLNVNGSPVHLPPPEMVITTDASKRGWGAVHQSLQTNGRWSQKESLQHINYLELKASFLALKTFLKGKSRVTVSLQLDNTTAIAYINNKGGTRSPQLMTLALEMWDWCQTRDIFVIASHIPGRDNVSADKESREFKDMSEWKLDPTVIQPFLLNCQTDLFASRLTNQLADYISWRPDPGAIHTDAFTINWAPLRGYAFPPLQSDIQDPDESNNRPNGTNSCCSSLANPALVAGSSETSNISASVATDQSNPLNGPDQPEPSSSNVPSPSLGRVSHLYQRFQAEGIPTSVADLLIAATRTSTHKTYESSWNRWCRWCSRRKVDPLSSSISDILIFLTEVFNEGLAYRSLNVLRSALSSTHPKIDGFSVGQHPYVTRLLKGALNKRPPKPRYSHTWNVDVMINYIISLGKNSTLSLKTISMKLVTLFALTCPERISALASLDLRHCHVLPEGVSFALTVPRKTGSSDKPAEAFFACFDQDKKLCPVECFRQYLKLSRDVRPVIPCSLPDKLFISFRRPHKPVTSTTLGRWLRTFMSAAGIDSQIFKAHSVRGASTTAAANAFVPLSTIMSMADWSSASTFRTFYYKPLFNSAFAAGVLSAK